MRATCLRLQDLGCCAGGAGRSAGLERLMCMLWDDGYGRRFAGCLQDGGREEPKVDDGPVQGGGLRNM